MTVWTTYDSPLGELLLVGAVDARGLALVSLSVPGQRNAVVVRPDQVRDDAAFGEVTRHLGAYFDGDPAPFEIAFDPGGTAFQRRVWGALEEIPYGTSTTYGALAARLGVAREDIRALGAAIGANPLLIVRPCHRVVGADNSLKGYAGGLERKRQLLTLEGVLQPMLG
jgi:methylated-DNA-[protein]-cysteine S-methyltransferase